MLSRRRSALSQSSNHSWRRYSDWREAMRWWMPWFWRPTSRSSSLLLSVFRLERRPKRGNGYIRRHRVGTKPHLDATKGLRRPLPPPEAVLVLVVHQSLGVTDVGQSGAQQAVVPVDGGQTLVLQLKPQRSAAFPAFSPVSPPPSGTWSRQAGIC